MDVLYLKLLMADGPCNSYHKYLVTDLGIFGWLVRVIGDFAAKNLGNADSV